jgi:DNA-binding GntR family transcriptional regulator
MLKIPKYPNLTELAYLQIKQHILEGTLDEDAKLTEETLAAQLGISKSPVREALNRLESEGLVSIASRRGAYVRRFSLKDACDVYAIREILEVHAVGLAEITPAFLRELAESIDRAQQYHRGNNTLLLVEEDICFHNLIASATGNQELCRILENINQKSVLCRMKTHSLPAVSSPNCHDGIYLALKDGDRERAQQAMRDHILYFRDSFLRSMQAEISSVAEEGSCLVAQAQSGQIPGGID